MRGSARKLEPGASVGLWSIGESAFVVFRANDMASRIFLLNSLDGRPAYSCVDIVHAPAGAVFAGTIELAATPPGEDAPPEASLGRLMVENGQASLTTVGADGQRVRVAVAPWAGARLPDGDHGFAWHLQRPAGSNVDGQPAHHIVHRASWRLSWLNSWIPPLGGLTSAAALAVAAVTSFEDAAPDTPEAMNSDFNPDQFKAWRRAP